MTNKLIPVLLFAGIPGFATGAPVHFLVAEIEPVHGDSYVLPLERPADIAHARELIAQGPGAGGSIVVAQIAPGADGINRNVLAPGEPLWSWHVTQFDGFADMTVEILDGWPTFVEQDVAGWIANTNGYIGFWNYTVTAELDEAVVPVPGAAALFMAGLSALGLSARRKPA